MLIFNIGSVSAWQSAATKSPVQTDRQVRELLQACLEQQETLDYLTAKAAALEKLDKKNKELIVTLDSQIVAQERTIAALKSIDATSGKIEALDAQTRASLEASLKDAKAEIARWQAKASFWKTLAGLGMVAAGAVGIAIGYAIGSK